MTPTQHQKTIGPAEASPANPAELRLRASMRATVRRLARQVVELSLWRLYARAARLSGRGAAARGARGLVDRHVVPQVAILVIGQATDTYKLAWHQIDLDEYGRRSLRNAGSTLGAVFGSAAGAAVGTLIAPGPGTAVGAMVGATLGSFGGEVSVERWRPGPQVTDAGADALLDYGPPKRDRRRSAAPLVAVTGTVILKRSP